MYNERRLISDALEDISLIEGTNISQEDP